MEINLPGKTSDSETTRPKIKIPREKNRGIFENFKNLQLFLQI